MPLIPKEAVDGIAARDKTQFCISHKTKDNARVSDTRFLEYRNRITSKFKRPAVPFWV
jgi:hypothetical protein